MSDTTRVIVPDGGSNDFAALAAMNGGMGGGAWNNPIWALAFLGIFANGFGGWGGNGGNNSQLAAIQEQLQTIQGNNALMSAITGGTNEVRSLANVLNADVNAVQQAINGVQSAICGVGNSVGLNSQAVINAIQSGNTAIANQIAQCCCDNKLLTTTQGYENRINNMQQSQLISNGFSQLGYANADNTAKVIAKLDAIEDGRKDREIASLTAALATVNARAERQAELAPIMKQLNDIACKQPQTFPVPYQPFTAVPNCIAYQAFGLNPFGLNNGQWS